MTIDEANQIADQYGVQLTPYSERGMKAPFVPAKTSEILYNVTVNYFPIVKTKTAYFMLCY